MKTKKKKYSVGALLLTFLLPFFGFSQYHGGISNGFTNIRLGDTCHFVTYEAFHGGSADGFSISIFGQACVTATLAPFKGGGAEGFSNIRLGDTCNYQTLEPFHGGLADGFTKELFGTPCVIPTLSPFTGGIADGIAVVRLGDTCDYQTLEPFHGGLADGFTKELFGTPCINPTLSPFTGGIADGIAVVRLGDTCDYQTLEPFHGGLADGFAKEAFGTPCVNATLSPFKGGIADGLAVIRLGDTCHYQTLEPFYGGLADGFAKFALLADPNDCDPTAGPLPIELLYFDALKETDRVRTEWTTMSERNNDYFTVERSLDGITWTDLGDVPGAGNSSSQIDYVWYDLEPELGVLYYRLRQTDFDGQFSHSNIRSVVFGKDNETEMWVYPNPTEGRVTLEISGEGLENASLQLYDATGSLIFKAADFTGNSYQLDLENYSTGIYIFKVSSAVGNKVFKIVKR